MQYVGSQACITCHEAQHASFRHTGMGRSMAEVDLSREPPDATFDHLPSRCRYEVRRKDGQIWHRELLLTGDSQEVLLQEYPVKYVTGSGKHSLTYLVEDDGFLVESPITWYASRQAWGMSPGYDVPKHGGFQREIGESCLVCHAGQVRAEGKSHHRIHVGEASIGCEQCHGPGELHLKRHERKELPAATTEDDTIVNPVRLSRELSEAICQQCHLRASAAVLRKGKSYSDFRPGLPLQDFRVDYALDLPNQEMTVVGHVEQMHQSRCYLGSPTFSCLTCHNPHSEPRAQERKAHYVKVCTTCHQPAHCRVSPAERQQQSPENDCTTCHMPSTPTDIPHLAFTHHRVAIHKKENPETDVSTSTETGTLRPVLDIAVLSEHEQNRSLGMAYLELSNRSEGRRKIHFQQQALALLSAVHSPAKPDGAVATSIARLRSRMGLPDVDRFAQSALSDPDLTGADLSDAIFSLADARFRQGRYEEAIVTLEPLWKLRRSSMPWLLRAQCEEMLNNEAATEHA
ncbi:MAG: hypothetical protein IAF94_04085, partial [Pirellulaceae bacterium]|nr:hypothetical protein [Pirellulaceae bacterium]